MAVNKSAKTGKKEFQAKIAELEAKLGSQAKWENQTSSSQSPITSKPTEKRGTLPKGW